MFTVLRRPLAVVFAAVIALTAVGCAGAPSERDEVRASTITVLDSPELGEVLVDGEGSVLYVFEPDDAATVTCTFTCASNWPPLRAIEDDTPTAGEGVDPDLFGTLPDPAGGEVVTYNGWPLYRYAADKSPGEHRGQDTNLNGGVWYVMQPDGQPLIP